MGIARAEEKVDDEDGEAAEDDDGPEEGAADGGEPSEGTCAL